MRYALTYHYAAATLLATTLTTLGIDSSALTTVADVNKALTNLSQVSRPFDISATVLYADSRAGGSIIIRDDFGDIVKMWDFSDNNRQSAHEGFRMRLQGTLTANHDPMRETTCLTPACVSFEMIASANLPEPRHLNDKQIRDGSFIGERVAMTGILRDVFRDEIDPNFVFMSLRCGKEEVAAAFAAVEDPDLSVMRFLGEQVTVSGFIPPNAHRLNNWDAGRHLNIFVYTHPTQIKPEGNHPSDPFAAPQIASFLDADTSQGSSMGRCIATGTILALWSGNEALLKTDDGQLIILTFSQRTVPPCGARITASGIPSIDIYRVYLRHALWRSDEQPTKLFADEIPRPVSIREIVRDKHGRPRYDIKLHGHIVTLRGRLILPASELAADPRFFMEQDGEIAPVDFCAVPDILKGVPAGSTVELTGICVMVPTAGLTLPRINGFFIAPRTTGDLRIIAHPPWWTLNKVLILLSVVLTGLVGMAVWNILLKRTSERRGTELANEKLSAVKSELKVYERTRLAIELHDLLSQMLSSISMQITAVRKFLDSNREKTLQHLNLAAKTLLACRESLRDCLWDLRNHTLEESNMSKAIKETLEPHIDEAALRIRFDVPRDRLTDNTAHAILCIIRELTVNAVRHGLATSVRIAGCIENGQILFSVSDNGCGFDLNTAPGMAQGHFGLQGIRERIEGFEGEMTINSAVGSGTKITIALNLPQDNVMEPINVQ